MSLYDIDNSVLVENRPITKFTRNYIRDSIGVFSIFSADGDIDDVISRSYTVVCAKILLSI